LRVRAWRTSVLGAVEEHAWDGEWWRRAYDAAGSPVGSAANDEGQIYIESQAWCALGGAGADGRARVALEAVDARLTTPTGIVLQQPAYTRYHLELGEITSYPPGVKENAGIFCHNNTWIHLAWCRLGEGDRALAGYHSICPSTKEDSIETYRCEPYVYAQTIAGPDSPTFGEAKNSWLTGTAAWTFVVASQGILGIQPDHGGLRIDPCIPPSWSGFTVHRRFRGADYEIEVANPDGVSSGVRSLVVDGRPVTGGIVPVAPVGARVRVEVVLGG
jgi:cellobiose phosphorylase